MAQLMMELILTDSTTGCTMLLVGSKKEDVVDDPMD
jgi:hypothetical protein